MLNIPLYMLFVLGKELETKTKIKKCLKNKHFPTFPRKMCNFALLFPRKMWENQGGFPRKMWEHLG